MTVIRTGLCIGGPEAGKRHDIEIGRPYFRVAVRPSMSVLKGPASVPEMSNVETVTYVPRHWYAEDDILELWVPEGQTILRTMELLLAVYEKREK